VQLLRPYGINDPDAMTAPEISGLSRQRISGSAEMSSISPPRDLL
jgi:hypothetical protein